MLILHHSIWQRLRKKLMYTYVLSYANPRVVADFSNSSSFNSELKFL